jgi:glycine cleavage system H protein
LPERRDPRARADDPKGDETPPSPRNLGKVGVGQSGPLGTELLWVRDEEDGTCTVGLEESVLSRLGPIRALRTPAVGSRHHRGDPVVSIESDKWVGHFPMPEDGRVVTVNESVMEDPERLRRDPRGKGWLFRFRPRGKLGQGRIGPGPSSKAFC